MPSPQLTHTAKNVKQYFRFLIYFYILMFLTMCKYYVDVYV